VREDGDVEIDYEGEKTAEDIEAWVLNLINT